MKSYPEMIQWHVDQVDSGKLRYYEWPSVMAIAHSYDVTEQQVYVDINQEKQHRQQQLKQRRRDEHRASNEARRLANLAKRTDLTS